MTHDPARQVGYLQQCLSQDKRSIGFLIGAGCPVSIRIPSGAGTEPLIPDVKGLTQLVKQKIGAGALKGSFDKIEAHLQMDGVADANVESHLSFIRGLRAIAGAGKICDIAVAELKSIETEICRIIGERVDRSLPTDENPYSQLAAWVASANRSAPVEVFTTNYDLLTEQAFERFRVPYFDGFSGSKDAFLDSHSIDHDNLPSRWARLWKLHGSINWCLNSSNQVSRSGSTSEKCIIHPSHLKYDESRRMPYLVMIDRLRAFIRRPSSVLIVCGYSFGDEHLNACLREGLTGSPRSAIFGLLFDKLAAYGGATKLARTTGNLALLAADGAVLGTKQAAWDNRDPGSVAAWSGAIEILDDPAGGAAKVALFRLGDFKKLGDFLSALIGSGDTTNVV